MSDERYEAYCAADPLFYDSLGTDQGARNEFATSRTVPPGWEREHKDDWLIHAPVGASLPPQGWKIHLSACLDNAERILDVAWDYCVPRGLPFKFLRGPRTLLLRNSKYAARGASGKFVTIYPRDEAELELVCKELAGLLDGEAGPYILSDLRYGTGPLYVRYGGFAARFCLSPDGQTVYAIADPDGVLVPDRRDPVFHLPEWVKLPDFLAPHLAARNAVSTTEVPYRIERVIHFSNGGGLYVGRDTRTETQVVLKEARPYAGLDAAGVDAVRRLAREAEVLRHLADIPQVPRVHDEFQLGEHQFLALEFIEGRALNKLLVERYPLIDTDAGEAERAGYAEWALRIHAQVEAAIEAIHARGIVYGDLHLFNIMVRPDDQVALVDFEVAAPVAEGTRPALGNQGFTAPNDRTGTAVDRYALACLRLALFLPLTPLLRLHPGKAAELIEIIAERFPVPRDFLLEAVAEITGATSADDTAAGVDSTARSTQVAVDPDRGQDRQRPSTTPRHRTATGPAAGPTDFDLVATPDAWPGLRDRLVTAITASATQQRDDRLFPGDIEQFRSGGLNLAHGAAGVLWALSVTGAPVPEPYTGWLLDRAANPPSGTRLGFYDGLHGVAYALDQLGHRDTALRVLRSCLDEPWTGLGPDLLSGLSGVALNLAEFAARTGDPALRDASWRAAGLVADKLDADTDESTLSGGRHPYAGLTQGWSGPALMFLRLYELSGDSALLDRAADALRRDLNRCVVRSDGAMEVNEGWRTMPYLAHGSVGIGLVIDEYLRHRPDDGNMTQAATAIRRAARSPFYAQTGLFAGRAGIIAYLAARTGTGVDGHADLGTQLRHLAWHALPYGGGTAFPGEQLLRLSMDLATGTAGVLIAAGSAVSATSAAPGDPATPAPAGRAGALLPFLAPLTGARHLPSAHAETGDEPETHEGGE